MNNFEAFFNKITESLERDDFVKLTLGKPLSKRNELQNVYLRLIKLKDGSCFSFTYRYKTNDQVKNYTFSEAKTIITDLLLNTFRFAVLFSLKEDIQCFISKKKQVTLKINQASFKNKLPEYHDKIKNKKVVKSTYLFHLGISDKEANIIPKFADKYRQINKYLEIINDLINTSDLPNKINIVDMGSGKGYLTFALYDFLTNKKGFDVTITGIELRQNLVNYCNEIAEKCNFNNLLFQCKPIEKYTAKNINILIALHACDTATDDALYKGITSNAVLIVTAPCCHKQIRQQLKGFQQESPILKYGIFKERQYEMVTDTLRALLLEKENYQTKIFEFISNEHTRKNIMLVGKKSNKKNDVKLINSKIDKLKKEFGIEQHYLEKLIN
ncbi:MAG: SAM-dependent methyltransferase [Flavobacteriaceae bacterium]|nr:SAM-dependent methyltransferase [Flavobacteriaceae bacterium]